MIPFMSYIKTYSVIINPTTNNWCAHWKRNAKDSKVVKSAYTLSKYMLYIIKQL